MPAHSSPNNIKHYFNPEPEISPVIVKKRERAAAKQAHAQALFDLEAARQTVKELEQRENELLAPALAARSHDRSLVAICAKNEAQLVAGAIFYDLI